MIGSGTICDVLCGLGLLHLMLGCSWQAVLRKFFEANTSQSDGHGDLENFDSMSTQKLQCVMLVTERYFSRDIISKSRV